MGGYIFKELLKTLPSPLIPLLGWVFLTLTNLHNEVPALKGLHLEFLLVALAFLTSFPEFLNRRYTFKDRETLFFLSCFLLAMAPAVASLFNATYLWVVEDGEYRSWAKALLLAPCFTSVFYNSRRRDLLLEVLFLSALIFCGIVLYHFYVLGEARLYDARPSISVKNGDPNFISLIFAFLVPLSVMKCLTRQSPLRLAYHTVLTVVFLWTVAIAESRMGTLSLIAAFGFLLFQNREKLWRTKWGRAGLAGSLLLILLLVFSVWNRLEDIEDDSNALRVYSYHAGLRMFSESPLAGKGWHVAPSLFSKYSGYESPFRTEFNQLTVHNAPLLMAAENGAIGLLPWILVMGVVAFHAWRSKKHRDVSLACVIVLGMNCMTIPVAYKDFFILFLIYLFTLNSQKPLESRE